MASISLIEQDIQLEDKIMTYTDFEKLDKIDILDNFKYKILNSLENASRIDYKDNDILPYYRYVSLINLVFWQDYYYLFYLSLKIIKLYKSNCNIISIGESPMKLIFTQSLFYDDPIINFERGLNNYPTNLTFNYFPISNLALLYKTYLPKKYSGIHFDDKSITVEIMRLFNIDIDLQILKNYLTYFIKFNLDPLSIIEKDNSGTIFVDRVESARSIISFIYLYSRFIIMQHITEDKLSSFLSKFHIIGYDGDYMQDVPAITTKIHECIKIWFQIDDTRTKHV